MSASVVFTVSSSGGRFFELLLPVLPTKSERPGGDTLRFLRYLRRSLAAQMTGDLGSSKKSTRAVRNFPSVFGDESRPRGRIVTRIAPELNHEGVVLGMDSRRLANLAAANVRTCKRE